MKQAWLISYRFSKNNYSGFGRFVNYREDGKPPSMKDLKSMESKVLIDNGFQKVCVLSVSRLADEE